MSTYLYLECLSHDPPLRAQDESGQHLYDLPRIQEELADREATVAADEAYLRNEGSDFDAPSYFRRNSARFLVAHQRCSLGIVDEYGRKHPVIA